MATLMAPALTTLLAAPGLAHGQAVDAQAAAAAAAAEAAATQIVITATRVNRTGFTAPTPITQLGAEDLEVRAAATVAELMFEMPAIRPAPVAPFTLQFAGGNYLNLRGLGNNRTLVLVDGRRFVPTTSSGIVDTNVVPAALVERIDMVTGGASAAWGSDAVAGVVNLGLRKSISGFNGSLQYGQSQEGDNQELAANLSWGSSFAGKRGEVMVAAEYSQLSDPVAQGARDWSRQQWGNVAGSVDGVSYARVLTPGLTLTGLTTGGVITAANGGALPANSPLRGIQFGPGGAVHPFTYGTNVGTVLMAGGSGGWISNGTLMTAPLERASVYGRATYEFSPALRGSLDASFLRSQTSLDLNPIVSPNSAETTALTISRANPYLPASVAAIMDANKLSSFSMGRISPELGLPHNTATNDVARIAAGLDGRIGSAANWKAYYSHGQTDYSAVTDNQLIIANWRAATDVVKDAGGKAVCNPATVTKLGAAAGCVPANVFGDGSIDPAVRGYVTGTMTHDIRIVQDAGGASIQGEPFATPAGPVSLVGGVELRHETIEGDSDPISKLSTASYPLGGFQIGNNKPISGGYNVREIFGETVVPLLANKAYVKSLDLNAALRLTDYSTSGTVETWKAGIGYTPVAGVLLRATRSRDIRAANFNELYLQGQNNSASIQDYGNKLPNGQPSTYSTTQKQTGNTTLQPEIAMSNTAGITLQNLPVQGLRASLDYYRIDVDGAISQVTPQSVINGCYGVGVAADAGYCSYIARDANNQISLIKVPFVNLQSIRTSGVDFELGYRFALNKVFDSAPGDVNLRLLNTYVSYFIVNDGRTSIDRAGEMLNGTRAGNAEGGPKTRYTFSGTWRAGAWTAFGQVRHIGGGVIDANPATQGTLAVNGVPSKTYFDASLQYTLFDRADRGTLVIFGKIDNITDVAPALMGEVNNAPRPTNFVFYDLVGRAFSAGLRFTY